MDEIDLQTTKNWTNLIKANLLNDKEQDLEDMVKFLMPLEGRINLVLIPHQKGIEKEVTIQL